MRIFLERRLASLQLVKLHFVVVVAVLFLLGVFQPIYGAPRRSPQLPRSAEETSTLLLLLQLMQDASGLRQKVGVGGKKKANPLYLELGATATGRCPSPPPLPGSGEHQPTCPQRRGTPSLSALPGVSATLNTVRKVSSKHL